MSDLAWIVTGYALVYGAMATYAVVLEARRARARRRAEEVGT